MLKKIHARWKTKDTFGVKYKPLFPNILVRVSISVGKKNMLDPKDVDSFDLDQRSESSGLLIILVPSKL